ncbi:MAG: hypothetical protein V9G08_12510 [Dermatophilaceae bacterium]
MSPTLVQPAPAPTRTPARRGASIAAPTRPTPLRLRVGEPAPVQQSGRTCGSASATVARLLRDGGLREALLGVRATDGALAAYEERVHRRTNGVRGPSERPQVPWPRALGTPPWGLAAELAHVTGRPYRTQWVRYRSPAALWRLYVDLGAVLAPDLPAAIYVGSRRLPRHIGLVVPEAGRLATYDPGWGRVAPLEFGALAGHRLDVGGWPVPWCLVIPN